MFESTNKIINKLRFDSSSKKIYGKVDKPMLLIKAVIIIIKLEVEVIIRRIAETKVSDGVIKDYSGALICMHVSKTCIYRYLMFIIIGK